MHRQEALRRLRQAKSTHIRWRAYAQAMVAGLEVDEGQAPVDHKACDFGQWYYGEGARAFGHWWVYRDIEDAHDVLHALYAKIYHACQAGRHHQAAGDLGQLIRVSRTLLQAIEWLEEAIRDSETEVF